MRKAMFLAVVVVGLLTAIERAASSELLFKLLFPGLAVGLLITGGHGGTVIEDEIAPTFSFVFNVLVYATVFVGIVKVQEMINR
jgi:hypothetical protein